MNNTHHVLISLGEVYMEINTVKVSIFSLILILAFVIYGQRGYTEAPYLRYEAESGMLHNAVATTKSYNQADLQSEASDQICVYLSGQDAAVEWTLSETGKGLVIRYSIPDGETGSLGIYSKSTKITTINLTSNWSWEYLWNNGNPNNVGIVNTNPRMRFDEVRVLLPNIIGLGETIKLVKETGNIHIDFIELEDVDDPISAPGGSAVYNGDGSSLQSFIDANGGKTIFIPSGTYNVNRELYFGSPNTKLQGAGMWYTNLHFTNNSALQGGLRSNSSNVSFSDLYLTTVQNSRSDSYKGINGVFSDGATIKNLWVEHFECGAWIGQYNSGTVPYTDGLNVSHCRFRNNYADGINLCKGTRNTIVEQCSFRNNGDDDMAMWSANGMECQNNTYRYNTSENCWRASGCAIYGGLNNKAHNLLIKDNLEAGLRIANNFPGVGFNDNGMHIFSNITITRCGTFNSLFNSQVGAIDILCTDIAGTKINNITLSDIDIIDSKNDAIFINKASGDGFYNFVFKNITVDGTGKEFPYNNVNNNDWGRGFPVLFGNNPNGYGTYQRMIYKNRGGNATEDVNSYAKGSFNWMEIADSSTNSNSKFNSKVKKTKITISTQKPKLTLDNLSKGDIYSVYSSNGKKIISTEAMHKSETVSPLAKGIYIISIINKREINKVFRAIIN